MHQTAALTTIKQFGSRLSYFLEDGFLINRLTQANSLLTPKA